MSARVCSPPVVMNLRDLNPSRRLSPEDPTSRSPTQPYFFPSPCGSEERKAGSTSPGPTATSQEDEMAKIRRVAVNLFGTNPNAAQYARDRIQEMQRRDRDRWNFDFQNDRPLEGRYKWEPVGNFSDSPENRIPTPTPSPEEQGTSVASSSSFISASQVPCSIVEEKSVPPPETSTSSSSTSRKRRAEFDEISTTPLTASRSSFSGRPRPKVSTSQSLPSTNSQSLPVISTVIESTESEERARKYVKTESSSRQRRITEMYHPVRKTSLKKRERDPQNHRPNTTTA